MSERNVELTTADWLKNGNETKDENNGLSLSQTPFNSVLASIRDAFSAFDRDWRYIYINEQALQLTERRREDFNGQTLWEMFPDLIGTEFERQLQQALQSGAATTFESYYAPWQRWLENRVYPTANGLSLFTTDISERRRTAEALHESEVKYRTLFESMREGYVVCEAIRDTDGKMTDYRFLQVNPSIEELTGLKRDQTLGRTAREVMPGIESKWFEIYQQVIDSRTTLKIEDYIVPLHRWYAITAFYYGEEQFAVLFDEITERKLRELNQQFIIDLNKRLGALSEPEEIEQTTIDALGEHLNVARCCFPHVKEGGLWAIRHEYRETETDASIVAEHRLTDYLAPEAIEPFGRGETLNCSDVMTDERTANNADIFALLQIRAFLALPVFYQGQWVGIITVTARAPRVWRADETELLREITARVYPLLERARARRALQRSETEFRQLANTVPQIVWVNDNQGNCEYLNEVWTEFTGLSLAETTPLKIYTEVIHPDDRPTVSDAWERARQAGELFEVEGRMKQQATGDYHWFLMRGGPTKDATGQIVKWFGTSTDITEIKRAEAALRTSQSLNEDVLDSMSAHISVLAQDGTIQFVNESWRRFALENGADWTLRGVGVGANYLEVCHAAEGANAEESMAIYNGLREILDGTRTFFSLEYPCHSPTTQRWFLLTATPLTRAGSGAVVAHQNITERRQAEAALREADLRFRNMADSATVLIWQTDVRGVTFVNHHYLDFFGADFNAIKGMGWADFLHPDDAAGYFTTYQNAWAQQQGYEHLCRFRNRDGQYRWLRNVGTPHRSADGSFLGFIGNSSDITAIKEADAALRVSEERYRSIVNQTLGGIAETDLTGRFVTVNDRYCEITGYTRTELMNLRMQNLTHPDDLPSNLELFDQIVRTGMPFEIEKRYVRRDGAQIWVHDSVSAVRDVAGTPQSVIAVALDITARKQIEDALRESEARFRNMADHAPVMIWVTTPDGTCTYLSQSWYEFTGQSPETGLGFGWLDATHPDDRESAGQIFLAANEKQEAFKLDYRLRRKDGTYRWAIDSATPRFSADGQFLGYIGSVFDITERKQMEDALRASEERFRMLADNMSQLAWTCDEKLGNVTWYNRRWLEYTGMPFDETKGWNWSRVHHPDFIEEVVARVKHSAETGEPWEDTFPLRGQDGAYRWFLSRALPIRDEAGKIVRWFGTNTDVTEQRAAEEALREADHRKDEFLAMLAHELRNPLASIRNATQVLKLTGPADASQQWAREVVERQTQQLTRLVDDLLDVSRITNGKITLQREPLALTVILQRAVETSRPLIDARKHQLDVTLPATPLKIEGDLTRLVQIVGNLLNNAAKYTDEGGHLTLSAAAENDEVVIRVRDDGLGLSADLLPHVFDLFTQADRSLDRSQGGLGIGLTLVRRLTEMHGGRVEARSEGPGHGSEFILRLPQLRSAECGVQSEEDSANPHSTHRTPQLRVLVVEDNHDSAEMMAFMLQLGGHEVRTVHDGEKTFAAAQAFLPQVILCDIGLPGMNGYEVAAQLRTQPEFQQTRLIALSGYGRAEDRQRSKEAGFDYHLTKPVEPDALTALLEALRPEC